MRHLKFTRADIMELFKSMITEGSAFQFDMEDIARIRTEMQRLINNLSVIYITTEEYKKQAPSAPKKSDTSSDSSTVKHPGPTWNSFVLPESMEDGASTSDSEEEEEEDEDDKNFINNDSIYHTLGERRPTDNDLKINQITNNVNKAIGKVETIMSTLPEAGSTSEHLKHLESTASILQSVKRQLRELVEVRLPDSNDEEQGITSGADDDMEEEEDPNKEQGQNDIQKGHEKEHPMDEGDAEGTDNHSAHRGVENCQPPVKKQENLKKKKSKGDLIKVQRSALVNELDGIYEDKPGETGSFEYVMCHLSIAQCLTDLVNSCLDPTKKDITLCLDPLQEGLAFLIHAMIPHVEAIGTFIVEPRAQQDKKMVLAFKHDKTAIGAILGSIDGMGDDLAKGNTDDSSNKELVKIQKAVLAAEEEQKAEKIRSISEKERKEKESKWLAGYERKKKADNAASEASEESLDKKVGHTTLKKYLTIGSQTRIMLLHCLHILLMDRVITKLQLCNAICHWSISESKDLRAELKTVAEILYAYREDDAPSDDSIDKMTIKTILKQIILPAIMLEEKKKSDGSEGGEEKGSEGEEKPIWKIATKIMISIFSGLVGHDKRVKTDGASVEELFEEHTLSVMKEAQEKTVRGAVVVREDREDTADYCCGDTVKHKDRRRRIVSIYLMLLLRKSMERALASCDVFDEVNEYFGSYSGTILRLNPTEVYYKTTFIHKNYFMNKIDDKSTKELLNFVKAKGSFEKKHLLITSQSDLDRLKSLAKCAYPTRARSLDEYHDDDSSES